MFTENELPEGWCLSSENATRTMKEELHRELCDGHVLFKKGIFAVARREDRDDILFSAKHTKAPLYLVHLPGRKKTNLTGLFTQNLKENMISYITVKDYLNKKLLTRSSGQANLRLEWGFLMYTNNQYKKLA